MEGRKEAFIYIYDLFLRRKSWEVKDKSLTFFPFNLTAVEETQWEIEKLLYDFPFTQKHWESEIDMQRHSFYSDLKPDSSSLSS